MTEKVEINGRVDEKVKKKVLHEMSEEEITGNKADDRISWRVFRHCHTYWR